MKSSNVLFSPKRKYIQFTFIKGVKTPENIHMQELESEHFQIFQLINQFPKKAGASLIADNNCNPLIN